MNFLILILHFAGMWKLLLFLKIRLHLSRYVQTHLQKLKFLLLLRLPWKERVESLCLYCFDCLREQYICDMLFTIGLFIGLRNNLWPLILVLEPLYYLETPWWCDIISILQLLFELTFWAYNSGSLSSYIWSCWEVHILDYTCIQWRAQASWSPWRNFEVSESKLIFYLYCLHCLIPWSSLKNLGSKFAVIFNDVQPMTAHLHMRYELRCNMYSFPLVWIFKS